LLRHWAGRGLAEAWPLARDAGFGWYNDGAPSMGAALAFFTLFSMAPLLLLVIAIAGIAIGDDTARELLFAQLSDLLGTKGAEAVRGVLEAADDRTQGVIAATLSFAALVVGAGGVFAELRRDLDRIWRFEPPPWRGVWNALRQRLLSFGMVLTIGFLMMVSLVASAAITAIGAHVVDGLPGSTLALRAIEFVASFAAITGLFAMIYKILPSERLAWGDVWVGAAMTSLLFWIGKYLIGLYLGKSAIASPFGAAGTLVVVIVWVYYSAQVFFLGAEFTRAYALRLGSRRPA
jgi:membrane protein